MDIRDIIIIAAKHWKLLLVGALVGLLAGFGFASAGQQASPSSQAVVQLLATSVPQGEGGADLYYGDEYIKARMKGYLSLAKSAGALDAVNEKAKLGLTRAQLDGKIVFAQPNGATFYVVTATADDPDVARELARLMAEQLVSQVRANETEETGGARFELEQVQRATLLDKPASRGSSLQFSLLGLFLFFGLSLIAAVAWERGRGRVASTDDLLGAGIGRIVGRIRKTKNSGTAPSAGHEEILHLRAALETVHTSNTGCVVVLTSAKDDDSVTDLAAALAQSFVGSVGRVLVVDADFLDHSIGARLRVDAPGPAGTTQAYTIQAIEAGAVDLLEVDSSAKSAIEVLGAKGIAKLIDQHRVEYDMVIVVAPRALVNVSAETFASFADEIVIVVKAGLTQKRDIARAVSLLRQASSVPVSGVIVDIPSRGLAASRLL